jgi:uncharacterized membrane protein
MTILTAVLLGLALLASAWSAGFFWSWSFTVMPGLSAASPAVAVEAMRAVNAGIATPFFAFVFFGPLPFALAAAAAAWTAGARMPAGLAAAAAVIYALGTIGVTFLVNVPLNNGLASATVDVSNAASVWRTYAAPWTAWNHLRVAASTAALLLLVLAAVLAAKPPPA